ncbi:MAG: histidine kinase [Deltaproteobacteria bacterium]|nr:histidine kinase [Deltaproteobacteria bacterium]
MIEAASRPWWRAIDPRLAAAVLGLFVIVGLVQGGALRLVSEPASTAQAWRPVVLHASGAIGAWFALPTVIAALAWTRGRRWWPALLAHVLGWLGFTAVHVAVMLALRGVVGAVLGIDASGDGSLGYQVAWEAQADLVLYAGLAAVLGLIHARGDRRVAELRAVQLEARLVEERLAALVARLDPHFLFNALNTVSAVMYEDLARTETLLASLGELLRGGLATGGPTWSLDRELQHVEHYAAICSARFGERLRIEIRRGRAAGTWAVPRLAIQGLVENAVKHNRALERPLTVTVEIRDARGLTIVVSDDGIGFDADASTWDPAHGLGRLRAMLSLLHGGAARISCARQAQGGATVVLELPCVEVTP